MKRPLMAVGALLLLSLTACASGGTVADSTPGGTPSTRPPFTTTTPGPIQTPAVSGTPADVPAARWDAILADLQRRGVAGEPTLVSAAAVTWNNGALGCPQPGTSYTEAIVEGMRVVVDVGGKTYDYRFGNGNAPVLCAR